MTPECNKQMLSGSEEAATLLRDIIPFKKKKKKKER
jgi:hypothetical protein